MDNVYIIIYHPITKFILSNILPLFNMKTMMKDSADKTQRFIESL